MTEVVVEAVLTTQCADCGIVRRLYAPPSGQPCASGGVLHRWKLDEPAVFIDLPD